ncbi:MAG: hypothetical protein A3K19_03805 [Lentisphaerae bacterium RIFOXYB12_FULL_65_16]|nr:MAG: hypothetical protein A3K18_03060 [Lentisphaerae bacterium RIFOXYA12_64_32]OGV89269.1 MAG: hypothetical protein A3K19_03805 [Lentisphaerae bacterium RIFOXYB12_FULL_65_16]
MRIVNCVRGGALLGGAVVLSLFATSCAKGPGMNLPGMLRQVERIPVVFQGTAQARLVIPADASKQEQDGAALLAEYIAKSTAARLDVAKEPAPEDGLVAIHCGATAYVKGLNLDVAKLDPNGYVIAFPDAHHVVLLGAGDTGQEYVAYEFLERYVGVRWLFPGAVGEYVPARPDLTIPAESVRDEPRFQHRLFSGLGKEEKPEHKGEQGQWAKRNRMHDRVKFHHNLWQLILPEQYGKTHPEFFPILKGQRHVPQPASGKTTAQDVNAQCHWQPCFTAPGLVDEAVRNICDYFAKNPQATSYSFGVNDSGGHCECEACTAVDGGRTNALGIRDASTGYYTWCNAVARGVNATYPDKRFGLLAYSGVYNPPPGLRLDEHIVPFNTYDRMKWANAEIQRKGHAATEEWEKAAPVLGWYDYIYGGQFYVAPRVYFHKMAEYLRYGYKHNVRHYYAEAYPSGDWHEGPKLYVLLKLLWDPNRDVDQLLQDWYACAVGPAAAPYLAEYFQLWEEFWTQRSPQTAWFRRNGDQQYLDFGSPGYMEALTRDDLRRCEELLNRAVAAATTDAERARARYFLDGFVARKSEFEDGMPLRDSASTKVVATVVASAFDKDTDGWGNWQRDYAKATFTFDAMTGHVASGALKVDATGSQASPLCFTRQIPVTQGKMYRAAVWIRNENLASDATVSLTIKWKDEKGGWLGVGERSASADAPKPGEWQKLSVCFKVGTGERWSQVRYAMLLLTTDRTDQGSVWFDDFQFEEIEPGP